MDTKRCRVKAGKEVEEETEARIQSAQEELDILNEKFEMWISGGTAMKSRRRRRLRTRRRRRLRMCMIHSDPRRLTE